MAFTVTAHVIASSKLQVSISNQQQQQKKWLQFVIGRLCISMNMESWVEAVKLLWGLYGADNFTDSSVFELACCVLTVTIWSAVHPAN